MPRYLPSGGSAIGTGILTDSGTGLSGTQQAVGTPFLSVTGIASNTAHVVKLTGDATQLNETLGIHANSLNLGFYSVAGVRAGFIERRSDGGMGFNAAAGDLYILNGGSGGHILISTNAANKSVRLQPFSNTVTFETSSVANGQSLNIKSLPELTTIAAAAFTDTTIQIPANAIVMSVSVRVTTVIPTAATFTYGIAGATARFGTGISTAATTTSPGTLGCPLHYASAIAVRITPNLTPADNSGRVRVTINYFDATPPTS